nr:hypothetical protein [Streptomyces boncukensis]
MGRLKVWSGLSYRQLERRATDAGHWLPYSTASTALGRDRLPREELVVAFVRACGLGDEEAARWAAARRRIAVDAYDAGVPAASPPAPGGAARGRLRGRLRGRWRGAPVRRWAVAATVVLVGAAVFGVSTDDEVVQEDSAGRQVRVAE